VLGIGLLCAFLIADSRAVAGAEQFASVFHPGVALGLQYGVAAIQGRRPHMEDMFQVVTFEDEPAAAGVGMTHFFAVYDGHGGKRAAAWAHAHLVTNLVHELATALRSGGGGGAAASPGAPSPPPPAASGSTGVLDGAAVDAFHRTDAAFLRQAAARGMPDGSTAVTCMLQRFESTAAAAGGGAGAAGGGSAGGGGGGASGGGGSGDRRLLIANLGDSRCVMVRSDGSALALSSDHKPNRPDERGQCAIHTIPSTSLSRALASLRV